MRASIMLLFVFLCAGCKKPSVSSPPTANTESAEMLITLGSSLKSRVIIPLDAQSPNHKGERSFSSSIDRDFISTIAFCYVGDCDLPDSGGEQSGGKLIALKFTQTSPESKKVIYTETAYCQFSGNEQTLIDKEGVRIVIMKHDRSLETTPPDTIRPEP